MDTMGINYEIEFQYNTTEFAVMASSKGGHLPFDSHQIDLLPIPALVAFYHTCLGFPVKDTWLEAIKRGNWDTFAGLSYLNVAHYCPNSDETILRHLAQTCQNVQSTKSQSTSRPNLPPIIETPMPLAEASQEVFLRVYPISKLYTDETGRFPVRARSGNQYVMIAYHMNGNLILQQAFQTKANKHRISAFNIIMERLAARRLLVDLNIRDNEASADFKQVITESWKSKFQLVPPDMHRRNKAKQMTRHFKNYFLSIFAGVDAAFPPNRWDLLLPQAKLTVNSLHQATINPKISAWEYFNGLLDFNKTPLAPVGCRVLIHAKPVTRRSWDYKAKQGFYIGPALDHYRCYKLVKSETKQKVISNTVKFKLTYLQIPVVLVDDKINNGLQVMAGAIRNAPPPTSSHQLDVIEMLRTLLEKWKHLAPRVLQIDNCPVYLPRASLTPMPSRVQDMTPAPNLTNNSLPWQMTMTRTRLVPQHGRHPRYPLQCQEHQLHRHASHLCNRPLPRNLSLMTLLLQVGQIQPQNQAHRHFQGCL
jgi:hypothetical protein